MQRLRKRRTIRRGSVAVVEEKGKGCRQTRVRVLSRPERTLHTDELNILYFVMAVRTSRLCERWSAASLSREIFRIPRAHTLPKTCSFN